MDKGLLLTVVLMFSISFALAVVEDECDLLDCEFECENGVCIEPELLCEDDFCEGDPAPELEDSCNVNSDCTLIHEDIKNCETACGCLACLPQDGGDDGIAVNKESLENLWDWLGFKEESEILACPVPMCAEYEEETDYKAMCIEGECIRKPKDYEEEEEEETEVKPFEPDSYCKGEYCYVYERSPLVYEGLMIETAVLSPELAVLEITYKEKETMRFELEEGDERMVGFFEIKLKEIYPNHVGEISKVILKIEKEYEEEWEEKKYGKCIPEKEILEYREALKLGKGPVRFYDENEKEAFTYLEKYCYEAKTKDECEALVKEGVSYITDEREDDEREWEYKCKWKEGKEWEEKEEKKWNCGWREQNRFRELKEYRIRYEELEMKEEILKGKLEYKECEGATTLMRCRPYLLNGVGLDAEGDELYHLIGKEVEIVGKKHEFKLEGEEIKEITFRKFRMNCGGEGYDKEREDKEKNKEREDKEKEIIPGVCDGCLVGERCYDYFSRIMDGYCNEEGSILAYVDDEGSCFADYQCKSGKCLGEQCISRTFIEGFMAWIAKLFGSY